MMEKKTVRRLPPCPAYDVEGMESWLTDLARDDGLFLVQDGIFAGVAEFEVGEPRQDVKYRLEAAPKSTSFLAEDGGEPDPEAVELNREFSWDYVGRRGDFYIYRTNDPTARELNTDPEVQALAIGAVKKRQAGSVFYLIWWLVIYPTLLIARGGFLRMAVETGTWFVLWTGLVLLWLAADVAAELVHLNRLMKKLRTDGALERNKQWRGRTVPYQVKNLLLFVLCAAWVIVGLNRWAAAEEHRHQPSDYQGAPPFATIADFGAPESYQISRWDWDGVREWSDWLAPRNLKWSEHAQVQVREGEYLITGGLEVEYHEMAAPFLARWMAWELTPRPTTNLNYQMLETPSLDVDYAAAFVSVFPTVVLQKGDEVLLASFYQYQASEGRLELEEWAAILAESLGNR